MYYLPIHFQCQANNFRCKRMIDGLLGDCKSALSNLISSDKVQESADPLKSFSEAIVNFHLHYCLDIHTSPWCHHEKVYIIILG